MHQSIALPWFVALFVSSLVWLTLSLWTIRRLRLRHAATFEAIGSPDLFTNNTLRTNWLFTMFLFRGDWRGLGDAALAVALRVMQVVFVVYTLGFLGIVAAFLLMGIERPR